MIYDIARDTVRAIEQRSGVLSLAVDQLVSPFLQYFFQVIFCFEASKDFCLSNNARLISFLYMTFYFFTSATGL